MSPVNVFRTYTVKVADGPLAVAICDALGYPERGMFTAEVVDGDPETAPAVAYVSSGVVDSESPIHLDAAGLLAALNERSPGHGITLAQCEAFKHALDATDDEPFARMEFVRQEIALGATAVPWVQPTGAMDAYAKDAVVSHSGQAWRSLIDANVWAPGVSGWRLLWATTSAPPEWKQPTGQHDAYNVGDLVIFEGKVYRSKITVNVWSPTAYPAGWELVL